MANFDFEELKRKASETASVIADKSAGLANLVANKTKILAKKAKLVADIAAEKESLKKQYQEMGRLYYEKFADTPAEGLEQVVAETGCILEKINIKKAELQALRTEEKEVEVEIEEIEISGEQAAEEASEYSEDE